MVNLFQYAYFREAEYYQRPSYRCSEITTLVFRAHDSCDDVMRVKLMAVTMLLTVR